MKKIISILFLFIFTFSFCFSQVKSFDLTDVNDYEDIEDNLVLKNKTSSKIYSVVIYGIKDKNCPGDFVLSDFCKKNDDGSYSFNKKTEKIATIRGLGAGKQEKISMDEMLLQSYRYYIIYVEEPSDFIFSIADIRESHEDLHITLEGQGNKKDVIVQKEYVYIDNSPKDATSSITKKGTKKNAETSYSDSSDALVNSLQKVSNDLNDWGNGKCSTCNGTGVCNYCKGGGKIAGAKCWSCHGTGKCTTCGGDGDWLYEVDPPAGASVKKSDNTTQTYSNIQSTSSNNTASSYSNSTEAFVDSMQKVSNDLNEWGSGKCSTCNGTGVCKYCKGGGKILGSPCWSCHGTGKCTTCGGDGDWLH